jgi:hypothetical protein
MRAASLLGTGFAFLAACEARTVTAVSTDATPPAPEIAPAKDAPAPWIDATTVSPDSSSVTTYNPYNPESDAALPIALDADLSVDTGADAALPVPATLACDADFPDGEVPCPTPSPVCADAFRLVSYQNGLCVWGWCMWQTRATWCSGGCRSGACAPPTR